MNCTICEKPSLKLTAIEVALQETHQLCDRCLLDLFTREFSDSSSEEEPATFNDNVKPCRRRVISEDKLKVGCSVCDEKFVNRRTLATHLRESHPEDKLNRCRICHMFFKGVDRFEEHLKSKHGGFAEKCEICLQGIEKGERKKDHERICPGRRLFECGVCRQVRFGGRDGLWKHLDEHGIEVGRRELECLELRKLERIYTCVLCGDDRAFEENSYWNHVHEVHDGHYLKCKDCGKTFRSRKHLVVHTGVQCKVGSKAREKAAVLSQLGESNCPHCAKVFRNRILLQNHVSKIHAAKPIVCDVCGLSLPNRNQLRYHQTKTHTEPTEQCPHCPKLFHLRSDLRQHLTTHESMGKFVCEECGRVFKRKVGLELHVKGHQNKEGRRVRPFPGTTGTFACELCDKRFRYNYVLVAHRKTHDPDRVLEKKYSCKECGNKFGTNSGLYLHMKGKYVHQKLICEICKTIVKGKERFEEHKTNHKELNC